ncbi:MAG: DUF6504 family protein [Lentisphaeria bacterium]|nr:DUF6504 family protein [Lentisphaeria bacterium]
MNHCDETFVCEQIKPVPGTVDTAAMSIGQPGFPSRFIWRKKEYQLEAILDTWKETGDCRHGSGERYVRKHWFRIRTVCGRIMNIYFERQAVSRKGSKRRWWLNTVSEE